MEVTADECRRARELPLTFGGDRDCGGQHPHNRAPTAPASLDVAAITRRSYQPARPATGSRGLLCAWRTVSAPFVSPDGRRAGACRGRQRDRCGVPAPGCHHPARGPRGGCVTTVQAWRSARHRGARVRDRDSSIRVDKIVGPATRRRSGEAGLSRRIAHRFLRQSGFARSSWCHRPDDPVWIAADLIAQLSTIRTHGRSLLTPSAARGCGRQELRGQMRAEGHLTRAEHQWRHRHHAKPGRGRRSLQPHPAPEHVVAIPAARCRQDHARRNGIRRRLERSGTGRLRNRIEPCASDQRSGARTRRAQRG